MVKLFMHFVIPIIIAQETMICLPNGPRYSDGDLITFTRMKCLKVPFNEENLKCLESNFVDLEEILPNIYD